MKAGSKILFGNWLIVALFIPLIIIAFMNIRELINDNDQVRRNHLIIKNIMEMKTLISDLEAKEREFLITGEEERVASYKKTEENLVGKVWETGELLKDKNTPEESDRFEKLKGLIEQWSAVAAKEIEIKNKIKSMIDSESENNVMNELEKEIDTFIDTEMTNFVKLMNTSEPVKSARPVLVKKNIEIRLLLADLKNGVSRFFLTGKPEYLLAYSEAKEKISNQINEIGALLTKDNQEQLQYIRKIKELSENWFETVASKTEIHKELDALISKGPGSEIMKEIYNEFESFITYKENLFTANREHYMKKEAAMFRIIYVGVGIAITFSLIISLILVRSISKSLPSVKESNHPYMAEYEIKKGEEVYQVANAINDSVGELTKIAVLLQEVSDSLKKKYHKWEMGE